MTEAGLYFVDIDASPRPVIAFYDFRTRRVTSVFEPDEQPLHNNQALSASRDWRTVLYVQSDDNSTIMIAENFQ